MADSTPLATVGILALQGCVKPHVEHFAAAGAKVVEIRKASELKGIGALVLPGGESTTMLKLIEAFDLKKALNEFEQSGKPIWGICAGAILMAREVSHPAQESFNWIDIQVERNAYGRQLESFETKICDTSVAFIRAPVIKSVGAGVKTLAKVSDEPVWVESGSKVVTTFHPELSTNRPSVFHLKFLEKISKKIAEQKL